ncbi:MAG TPA: AAA family ATPase, partial [Pseudobdellovibrionaceae bacterium]|nr:AAA family ATPase [Pseudobdellovibrionaceae bacterium]
MSKKAVLESLSPEQSIALQVLQSGENVFLTGGAGSGKSYIIRHFMQENDVKELPILASTGAAAVLLGGRTFHSFFGLGIMDGGPDATFERAGRDPKRMARLKKV